MPMIMSARRSNFTLEFLCLTRINLSPCDQFEDLSNEFFQPSTISFLLLSRPTLVFPLVAAPVIHPPPFYNKSETDLA